MIRFETLFQDLRYGVRALRRSPGFTVTAVLALALGIGVNTAAFTAYKAFIARPLDARDSEAMVNVGWRLQSGAAQSRLSYPDYEASRERLRSFSGGVIAVAIDQLRLRTLEGFAGSNRPEGGSLIGRLGLARPSTNSAEFASTFIVSENYFQVLGVPPIAGRGFDAISASELAASPVVLISENYWQRRFGGDPAIVGKTVMLNGAVFSIAGITPHDFVGTSIAVPDFWLPASLEPLVHPEHSWRLDREDACCRIFARLAPGVTMAQAQAEATLLAGQLRELHDARADVRQGVSAEISPGSPLPGKMPNNLRLTIALIMTAVGMVLVIACANAAGLQLARATTRHQELGIRLSLGATRMRVISQLLIESALIGLLAGVVALPLTWGLMHVAVTQAAEALPIDFGTFVLNVNPDLEIFGYVSFLSIAAGLLFGLAPAIESSRAALFAIIRQDAASPTRRRLRQTLIAAQVAVSLALMIAGALLVRSAHRTLTVDTGYATARVIDVGLLFPEDASYTPARKAAIVRDLRARLAALPGVAAITSARAPDESGAGRRAAVSLNGERPTVGNRRAVVYYTWVQANYFQTLGIPLSAGLGFQASSGESGRTAILSESAARRLWPGEDPIGRSLRLGTDSQFYKAGELLPDGPIWQVIGVARDTRGGEIDGSDSEQIYLPLPANRLQDHPLLVRTTGDPQPIMRAMDALISSADPNLVASMATLQQMLRQTSAFLAASLSAAIASTISFFGLLLASMGIYSTVSYLVVLRTREVGIRMAMGAQRRDILALMIRESGRPVFAGLLAGLLMAIGAARLLRGVLYGLSAVDAIAFLGASLLFLTIALIATWFPSRRATRIDPLTALRYE